MQQELTLTVSRDEAKKKRLYDVIQKKKAVLLVATTKYELLKMELDTIKREYFLRVGNLFARDNSLDLEIIRYKHILMLMQKGMSYKDALKKLQESFLSDETEEIFDEGTVFLDGEQHKEEGDRTALKALWKKAVMKFHPDLATDPDEKKEREHIMKQINLAYAEGKMDVLEDLYTTNHVVSVKQTTIEELERAIVHLESTIERVRRDMVSLKTSEWYGWKTKMRNAKKNGIDVFKDLERAMLDDIAKKMTIIASLRKQVGEV